MLSKLLVRFFCSQLLQKEPSNRLGTREERADEAKAHSFFRAINLVQLEAGMVMPPFIPDVSEFENFTASLKMSFETLFEKRHSKFENFL